MLSGLLECGLCGRPYGPQRVPALLLPETSSDGGPPGGTINGGKVEREVTAAFVERVGLEYAKHAKRKGRAR